MHHSYLFSISVRSVPTVVRQRYDLRETP
jgi:hypothetical protein